MLQRLFCSGHSAEQFFKYRSGPERNIFPFRVKEYAFNIRRYGYKYNGGQFNDLLFEQ